MLYLWISFVLYLSKLECGLHEGRDYFLVVCLFASLLHSQSLEQHSALVRSPVNYLLLEGIQSPGTVVVHTVCVISNVSFWL